MDRAGLGRGGEERIGKEWNGFVDSNTTNIKGVERIGLEWKGLKGNGVERKGMAL